MALYQAKWNKVTFCSKWTNPANFFVPDCPRYDSWPSQLGVNVSLSKTLNPLLLPAPLLQIIGSTKLLICMSSKVVVHYNNYIFTLIVCKWILLFIVCFTVYNAFYWNVLNLQIATLTEVTQLPYSCTAGMNEKTNSGQTCLALSLSLEYTPF